MKQKTAASAPSFFAAFTVIQIAPASSRTAPRNYIDISPWNRRMAARESLADHAAGRNPGGYRRDPNVTRKTRP